jgi:hypothetical protein
MLRFLKWTKILFWWGLGVLTASMVISVVAYEQYHFPTQTEIQNPTNISTEYSRDYQRTILKSRMSSVLIVSGDILSGMTATQSATYFVANDTPYIITTAHGILGPCFSVDVSHEEETIGCTDYMIVDREADYAIIKIEDKFSKRTPIRIPEDLPLGKEWKKSYSILSKIIYTGYPNMVGPLTLKGDVVGYTDGELVYIFSHAYNGSSGSGVFSTDGKYIGMIMAIDIGQNDLGVDVLENIVIVTPSFKIDWAVVLD